MFLLPTAIQPEGYPHDQENYCYRSGNDPEDGSCAHSCKAKHNRPDEASPSSECEFTLMTTVVEAFAVAEAEAGAEVSETPLELELEMKLQSAQR
ncbi:uncharacterized protein IUM83_06142 [Phytophthora cinnamomi]|uniref:uncharacterized protein n=1 Tax=Phytophthora cinnamomi TaxID=4785 RepID=UPI003559C81B|nr:hypothetical protein IUM83_06142 [Phytophthora cinnamomi]